MALGLILGLLNMLGRGGSVVHEAYEDGKAKAETNNGRYYKDSHGKIRNSRTNNLTSRETLRCKTLDGQWHQFGSNRLIIPPKDMECLEGDTVIFDIKTGEVVRNLSDEKRKWKCSDEYRMEIERYSALNDLRFAQQCLYDRKIKLLDQENRELQKIYYDRKSDRYHDEELFKRIHELSHKEVFYEYVYRNGSVKAYNMYPYEYKKLSLGYVMSFDEVGRLSKNKNVSIKKIKEQIELLSKI